MIRRRLRFAAGNKLPNRKVTARRRLWRLEALENRQLLSTSPTLAQTTFELDPAGGGAGPYGAFSPAQIEQGYGFNQISFNGVVGNGSGETIAIVDAYDDPKIQSDANTFDTAFGLPSISLTVVNQTGGTTLPASDSTGDWELEESLDVEWAHAMASGASILLVEANSNSPTDLSAAVQYAENHANVVSMSFVEGELPGETAYDSEYRSGVALVASSGDSGAPPSYPAASPNVLSVGGTALTLNADNDWSSEVGWSGSGGGPSLYESQPSYQSGVVTQTSTQRATPDVAYDASPSTGFAVYDSVPYKGTTYDWVEVGGTSAGAPQWSALLAIADQGLALNHKAPLNSTGPQQVMTLLYQNPQDFHDITSGTSTGNPNYSAGPGYDYVTGLGSPMANLVVDSLVSYAPPISYVVTSTSGSPSTPGTLPYVVAEANANTNPLGSVISFDPSVFSTPQTIDLAGTLVLSETHGPEVIDATAAGVGTVTVSGMHSFGVMEVGSSTTAELDGLTISDGSATDGGGIDNAGTLTLFDVTLSSNTAAFGGAIYNSNSGTLTIGGTLSGNTASFSGGGIDNDGGDVNISDGCSIASNSAGNSGGGIYQSGGTVTINSSPLANNTAGTVGGGICVGGGSLTITASTLAGNTAGNSGGGVFNDSLLYAANCTLYGNDAEYGGGLSNEHPAIVTACTISANSATNSGGGIDNIGFGVATLTDTIVAGNNGPVGPDDIRGSEASQVTGTYNLIGDGGSGGISNHVDNNTVLTSLDDLDLSPLAENGGLTETMAVLAGSAAIGAGTTADYPGTTTPITTDQRGEPLDSPPDIGACQRSIGPTLYVVVSNGSSSSTPGTLPYVVAQANSNPDPDGSIITFDPMIFGTPQTIDLAGTLVLSETPGPEVIDAMTPGVSTVTVSGMTRYGVIEVGSSMRVQIEGLTISDGSATYGGGIDNAGTLTLTDVTLSANQATFGGGGIYADSGGAVTIIGGTLKNNTAYGSGYAFGGGLGAFNADVKISDGCSIANNSASIGGGIFQQGGAVTITGSTLRNNTAHYGGGIYVDEGSLTITGGTLSGNTAYYGKGGGIDAYYAADVKISDGCSIAGNRAGHAGGGGYQSGGIYQSGGGIYQTGGAVTINSSTLANNTAGRLGGGIYVGYGSLTITASTLAGNTAAEEGGGVNQSSARVVITGSTLTDNTAGGGGGIDVYFGSLTIGASTLTDNTAVEGGAILSGGTVTITGSTLTDNTAGSGGGIGVDGGSLTIIGSTLTDNTAVEGGGVLIQGFATVTIIGSTLTDNTTADDGGAIVYEDDDYGSLTITGGTLSGNTASISGGGIYNDGGDVKISDGCVIANNSAGGDSSQDGGGGIFQSGGAVTITGSTLANNTAGSSGGGVYVLDGSLTITGGTLSANTANVDGGGVYNAGSLYAANCTFYGNAAGDDAALANEGSATVTACTISGNSAMNSGGGIYNTESGVATLTDTIVAGNTGADGADDINGDEANQVTGSYNLIGTGGSGGLTTAGNNLLDVSNPLLAPLANYGGPTETMALLPGSLALGAGIAINGMTTDQRGEPLASPPDIGAVQSQGFTITTVNGSTPQTAVVGTEFANPLAVEVTASNPLEPVAGGIVTFSVPSSGASAVLSTGTATIGADGVASVTATVDTTTGSYAVTASAAGATAPASFALTVAGYELVASGTSENLVWYGTSGSDELQFAQTATGTVQITVSELGGVATTFTATVSGVRGDVVVNEYDVAGDTDVVDGSGLTTISSLITVGDGNDTLIGGGGANTIIAGNGDNTIYGNGIGNSPNTSLKIQDPSNTITVGSRNNIIYGNYSGSGYQGGNNTITAGDGNNTIDGNYGEGGLPFDGAEGSNNTITVGNGDNTIYGNYGDADGGEGGSNTIIAGNGNDVIYGNAGGNDPQRLCGSNFIQVGNGNDTIYGNLGGDGGEGGNNTILTGSGQDTIYGNFGGDGGEGGNNLIVAGGGNDTIYAHCALPATSHTSGKTAEGRDLIIGGTGTDTVYGWPDGYSLGSNTGDLFVAGTTNLSLCALDAVLAEWDSSDSYATRVADLSGANGPLGANGGNDLISGTTVIASTAVDQIFGTVGSDDDWYLVTSNDVLENVEQNEVTYID